MCSTAKVVKRFEAIYTPELVGGEVIFTDYEMVAEKQDSVIIFPFHIGRRPLYAFSIPRISRSSLASRLPAYCFDGKAVQE